MFVNLVEVNQLTYFIEKYRRSFPNASASSSFASSSYREDSTDTDSSFQRSPKHGEPVDSASTDLEPHYQFRKSNSMKLALREDEEGVSFKEE